MYGFKPKGQRPSAQHLADGGFVAAAKRMLGITPEDPAQAAALAEYRANAAREKAAAKAAAAAPAPAPQAALTQYSGMSAMQRREKEQGLANGGIIRGPGDGTSDSIPDEMEPGTFIMPADSTAALGLDDEQAEGEKVPVRVSNGEYELPPERVQAVGAAVLQAIKGLTHTPTEEAAEGKGLSMARGFHPKGEQPQFFASGGEVQSPDEQERMKNQTDMYVQGAQAAAASRPPEPPAPAPAPAPSSQSDYARQMSALGNALADGASWLGKTIVSAPGYGFNKEDQPSPAPASSAPSAAPVSTANAGRGSVNPTAVNPSNPPPAAPSSATAIAPGVYRNAPGQYSDSPTGTSLPAGVNGQPSAQSMAAADNLAPKSASASAPVAAGFPRAPGYQGVTAPIVRNSSNDWQARNNLRNLEVSASSITNDGGPWDRHGKGGSIAMGAYKAALANDQALEQARTGANVAAMRENAGLQREDIQQTASTDRVGMIEAGANARDANRTNLATQELGMKQEAQGFQTRAAKRLESLQDSYVAEKDPVKLANFARQIREIQGKEQPARYKVASGGQQFDDRGVPYKVPDRVFNEQTGVFSDGGGAKASPYKEGQRLTGKDGKPYVVKNGVPVPA